MAPQLQTELGKQLGEDFTGTDLKQVQRWAADYADRLTIEAHSDAAYKQHSIGAHFADAKIFKDLATALQPFTGAE